MKILNDVKINYVWAHFLLGASLYVGLELLWRGYTHFSMFLAGGTAYVMLVYVRRRFVVSAGWFVIAACIGAVVITAVELVFGIIFNIILGMNVWDYSQFRMNFVGQISLTYSLLWIFVAMFAFAVDFGVCRAYTVLDAVRRHKIDV